MPAVVQLNPARNKLSSTEVQQWFDSEMPVEVIDARLLQLIQATRNPDPDAVWDVLAVLDQNYRRGRLDAAEFKRLKARIERHALGAPVPDAGDRTAEPPPAPAYVQSRTTRLPRPSFELRVDQGRDAPEVPRTPATVVAQVVAAVNAVAPVKAVAPVNVVAPVSAASLSGMRLRDRFVLQELLGEGGMSCVYRASDRQRESATGEDAHIAIKMLRTSLAARPDALRALRLEYDRAQRLSHPAIIKVFDLDSEGDRHFITMELLQGELLSDVIRRLRPGHLRPEQAWAIIAQLGDALAYAHGQNVIHADIKPGNVMITRGGELRLFDFGAAWLAQREPWIYESSVASMQGATPSYASADRLSGEAPTTRDDIFSFCCLAYELLSGEHPYARRPANQARDSGARLKRIGQLTGRQWRALRNGLSFRREDRPGDLRAVLRDLGAELGANRRSLLLNLRAEPQRTASRVSGLSMVLLGTLAFATVHVLNSGGMFDGVPWIDAIRPWFKAAEGFVINLFR